MIYKGFWFIPEYPDEKFFGILTISNQNDIELELFREISEKNIEDNFRLSPHLLLGETEDDQKITLFNYYKIKGQGRIIFKYNIKFKYCYIGKHFNHEEEIKFSEINFKLTNLLGWFNEEEVVLISYKKERKYIEKQLYKSDEFSVFLLANNFETRDEKKKRITIERIGKIKLKYKNGASIYDITEDIKYIQLLFSILMLKPIYVTFVEKPFNINEIPTKGQLIINDKLYFQNSKLDYDKVIHHSRLISNEMNEIFTNWFDNRGKIKSIIELLLATYFSKEISSIIKFLNIITAFESWHREFIKDKDEISLENYKQILELISNKDLAIWFKNKKIIFQSLSLPKRLDDLIERDKFSLINNKKNFKKICVNTRNQIAHNLPLNSKVANNLELSLISDIIKILFEELILEQLGIERKFIERAFEKYDLIEQVYLIKEINKFEKF